MVRPAIFRTPKAPRHRAGIIRGLLKSLFGADTGGKEGGLSLVAKSRIGREGLV